MRSALAAVLSVLVLWWPTLVVGFKDYVYETDLSAVQLHDACLGSAMQTVFVFCLLEVLIAALLLKNLVVPSFFSAQRWASFDEPKRKKLVGLVIKGTVRASCAAQILVLVSPYFSMDSGLFPQLNVKQANRDLVRDGVTTSCEEAGLTPFDAAAVRAWVFARDSMMAVMVWELAFIPELQVDVWLHHLFIILGVTLGSDPQILGAITELQPFVDGVAFLLVLGATLMASQELGVLMYHVNAPDAHAQAAWMAASAWAQGLVVAVFFVGLPIRLVVQHRRVFGPLSLAVLLVLAFLAVLELKMILVKRSVVAHARRKAHPTAAEVGPPFPAAQSQRGSEDELHPPPPLTV